LDSRRTAPTSLRITPTKAEHRRRLAKATNDQRGCEILSDMAEESRFLTYSDIRGLRPLPMLAHFVLDEST
jgi:hypothetical protein